MPAAYDDDDARGHAAATTRRWWWAVLLLNSAVLLGRCWQRLVVPHLWAEDGSVFLPQALEWGSRSLLLPFAGYHHLGPRLVAYLATTLPLRDFALACSGASLAAYALTSATLMRPGYGWLLRRRWLRAATCVAACAAPGLHEVLGNLANLHNVLVVYWGLVLLRGAEARLHPGEWLLVVLALGSEGGAVAWLPMLALRLWLQRGASQTARRRNAALTALFAASVVAHVGANLASTAHGSAGVQRAPAYVLAKTAAYVAAERLVVLPLFGANVAERLTGSRAWLVASLTFLAALVAYVWRRRGRDALLLLASLGCCMGLYGLTWLVRGDALMAFLHHGAWFYGHRYVFVSAPFALVLYAVALDCLMASAASAAARSTSANRRVGSVRVRVAVATALAVAFFCASVDVRQAFSLGRPLGGRDDWYLVAAQMDAARAQRRCVALQFACNPGDWPLLYRSPRAWCP